MDLLDAIAWPEGIVKHPTARRFLDATGAPGLHVRMAMHTGPLVARGSTRDGRVVLDGPAVAQAMALTQCARLGGVWVSADAWEQLCRQPDGGSAIIGLQRQLRSGGLGDEAPQALGPDHVAVLREIRDAL